MRTHTVTAGWCLLRSNMAAALLGCAVRLMLMDWNYLKKIMSLGFRSEGESQHCLTLSLHLAGWLTAISEASTVWIESLLSASANPLLHLINHELAQTQSHNTLQRNWKERGKMCLSKQNPLEDVSVTTSLHQLGHVEQMFHKDRKMFSFHLLG